MSNVLAFRGSENADADRIADEMWALVEKEDVITGIYASVQVTAMLIAGHGKMHSHATGLADRCAEMLRTMVANLKADIA